MSMMDRIAGGGAKQSYAKGEVGVNNGLVESYIIEQCRQNMTMKNG